MRVSLLGPVEASDGDTVLELGGPKQRAVLALLALDAGRAVPFDRFVDELWHDEPPPQATVTLRSYVSRLRRALEQASEPAPIVTKAPGWLLGIDRGSVDVHQFTALLEESDDEPDPVRRIGLLEEALGLWRGEALADLDDPAFAVASRARLEEQRLAAVEMTLETRLQLGRTEQVVADARELVSAHPYRERGWQALMLALYRSGRQSDAIAAAREVKSLLAEELGLDAARETRALEEQILRQDPALALPVPPLALVEPPRSRHERPDTRGSDPSARHAEPPEINAGAGSSEALVGRSDETALIRDAVARAASGRGGLVVLEAEPGQGKSTLLEAVAEEHERRGGLVLRGGAAVAGTPALWPWVTVVSQLARHLDAADVTTAPMTTALALMQPGDGGPAPQGELVLSQTSLYRGVLDLLLAIRLRRPVAVLIDDAHWADRDTLTLLALAVDELAPQGLLVAVALRTDEPGSAFTRDALAAIRREHVTRLSLGGMDKAGVGALVGKLIEREPDPALVDLVHTRSNGNPLFVVELVRLLAAERRLDVEAVRTALPPGVRDVIGRRVDRLPEDTIALLAAMSVLDRSADLDLLAAVTGREPDIVLDSCETALVVGLVREEASSSGTGFVLAHDLVGQTMRDRLSTTRTIRLHARIADALQAEPVHDPRNIVAVAHHLRLAAPAVGPMAAIPYLVQASEDALSRYSGEVALEALYTAVSLAGDIEEPEIRIATEDRLRGRIAQVSTTTLASPPAWVEGHEPVLRPPVDPESAASWSSSAILTGATGHIDWTRRQAEAAMNHDLPPESRLVVRFALAWAALLTGQLDAAADHLELLRSLIEDGGVRVTGAIDNHLESSYFLMALHAHARGDDDASVAFLDTADRLAPPAASSRLILRLYRCLIGALRGHSEEVARLAAGTVSLADELGYDVFRLQARVLLAWSSAIAGDVAALDDLEAGVDQFAATGLRVYLPMYYLLAADAALTHHQADRAAASIARSAEITAETGEVPLSPRLLLLRDTAST